MTIINKFFKLLVLGILLILTSCVIKDKTSKNGTENESIPLKTISQENTKRDSVFHNEDITTNSVEINGSIPFHTTRDSLLLLIKDQPIFHKFYEDCVSYGSKNDTLEYISFNDSTIVYIYYNNHAEFVSLNFENRHNTIKIGDFEVTYKTTFEELCNLFPNSCKEASFDKLNNEIIIRFHPREGFYESYEFWSIRFINKKIKYMRYNMTC